MSAQKRKANWKKCKSKRASSNRQQPSKGHSGFISNVWTFIMPIVLIAPVVAVIVFQSVQATAMQPSDGDTTDEVLHSPLPTPTASALGNSDVSDAPPYPYFYPDTEVLVYTGHSDTGWRPMSFAMVHLGGEFQFDGYLCGIDQEGQVWVSPNITTAELLEADRNFDPYNWRWPESEDIVRFVDRDNRHLRHDRMGRFQAGDRFWFQGILWEAFIDLNSPTGVSYWQTAFVQNENGEAVLVDGYPARGALNEGAYSQAGYTLPSDVASASTDSPSNPPSMESIEAASLLVSYSSDQSLASAPSNIPNLANLGTSMGAGQPAAPLAQSSGGAQLSSGNGMPTDFGFAGQRYDSSTGLIHMGVRYYDPVLGRFISPDPIVPDPGNPQALNRYTYAYNNPLRFVDPSGYDPIDEAWEQSFYEAHGRMPTDQDRRDRIFSVIYLGSGPNGTWTDDDWILYSQHREELWSGTGFQWPNAMAPGLDRFIAHLERLATYYNPGEENFYAQAIGFIWGGVPLGHAIPATWQMATNPGAAWAENIPLFEGTEGWDPALVDDENPSHHYAGLFYLGYFYGPHLGCSGNWLRDGPLSDRNVPDLNLGYIGVHHGAMLFDEIVNMGEVGTAARFALDPTPGIWSIDTPGMRVPWYYPRPWAE